jgi:hypothetical protein
VHALHNIHAALAPGGIVIDTQPVSSRPPVAADGIQLGILDMREWLETIRSVDECFAEVIAVGLYDLTHEERFIVTDSFERGSECLATVSEWRGTRVPPMLATRLAAAEPPVTVGQDVKLRLLRRRDE